MKNFKKTFNRGRGGDFGKKDFKRGGPGKRQFGSRDRERPQMHEAICSDCGKRCEVPFKPTGDKPIYCRECFLNHKGDQAPSGSKRRDYERPRFQDKKMFGAICDKCGKRFELPFRPSGDKPVYCNECFGRSGSSLNKSNDKAINQYKEQFEMLNSKLDRIIKVLTPVVPAIVPVKEKNKGGKEKKEEIIVKKKKKTAKKEEKAKKSNNLTKKPVNKKKRVKK